MGPYTASCCGSLYRLDYSSLEVHLGGKRVKLNYAKHINDSDDFQIIYT